MLVYLDNPQPLRSYLGITKDYKRLDSIRFTPLVIASSNASSISNIELAGLLTDL